METLLNIPKPKSKSFIIWEHIMKSAVAFIGTFAMLFFGPLLFAAKTRDRGTDDSISFIIVDYLIKHPEAQFGISFIALVIINIVLLFKNQRIKYVVKIEQDDYNVQITSTNLYYSKQREEIIPKKDFEFYIISSSTADNEKRQKIVFRNSSKVKMVGEINPKHFFWSENLVQVRNAIQELKEFRKPNVKGKNGMFGINWFTGWK